MKYLFINCVAGFGSTGRIVADACRELMAQGHECRIAFGRKTNGAEDIPAIPVGSKAILLTNVLETRLLDNEGFAARESTRRLVRKIREYDPDVIWLHNLHGYYLNLPILFSYLKTCGKEIRWTLHDCWAFTGHCVYFDYVRCDKWKTGCSHCPQKREFPASYGLDRSRRNYEMKKRLFTGIPNVTLYTPSNWLAKRVKQSFLKDYPVEVLYNTVDPAVFRPVESDFRKKHGLENKKMLLGVASVWERRKGLHDFVKLSGMLDDRFRIVLVGLPPELIRKMPESILALPRTTDVQELVGIYSAADLYVCPSTEETFGMTVLEAMRCGTNALVYQDTACEEVAVPLGGVAVPRGVDNLKKAILELLEGGTA